MDNLMTPLPSQEKYLQENPLVRQSEYFDHTNLGDDSEVDSEDEAFEYK